MTDKNKDLKDIIAFILSMANAIGRSLEDGRISVVDAVNFVDPAFKLGEAFAGIGNAVKQFDDLTDEDKAEIYDYIDYNFDIDTDSVEPAVESCLKAAICLCDLVFDFLDNKKPEN
jgi:hypothetical protein